MELLLTCVQRLDNVEEPYINHNGKEDDVSQHYHQGYSVFLIIPSISILFII